MVFHKTVDVSVPMGATARLAPAARATKAPAGLGQAISRSAFGSLRRAVGYRFAMGAALWRSLVA